jgi:DNA repair protein RadA/Sms
MTRTLVRYRCAECGAEAARWLGRCPDCGEWNTFAEEHAAARQPTRPGAPEPARPLAAVDPLAGRRTPTGVGELDRVLGGGLVPGSVTLLGGEPGIGKSTLLLQALAGLAPRGTCLLVSAEESPEQVRLRAERVGALHDSLLVAPQPSLPEILAHVEATRPSVLAVDSIQTVFDPDVGGVPGSVTQVRECATALVRLAKERGVAVVLVGHVTKEGSLAGPRALEHVVDTVLSFEGERHHALRLLRAVKHRFAPTDELGLFEMREQGLEGVADPSRLFLADRREGAPGSAVGAVIDAGRPLLVEVQALVVPTEIPVPRRSAQALDGGRLAMLLAVLERHGGIGAGRADVYASVAGGVRIGEPGVDLALALALASACMHQALPGCSVAIGEIGLGGEVRQVARLERRLQEAARLGFRHAIVPPGAPDVAGLEIVRVGDVGEALLAARSLAEAGRPPGPPW